MVKRNDGSTYTTDCYFCHGKGKKQWKIKSHF
ncbi:hypothetical protein [Gallibacterium anatis]